METWEGWRAGGEEGESRVLATVDGGASGRRCGPGRGKGKWRRRKAGGWGEGGREGLICPSSCLNKRRPPAWTAHAGRGRSEGEPAAPRARAHIGDSTEPDWAGRKAGRARGFADRPGGWPPGEAGRARRPAQPWLWQAVSSHAGLRAAVAGGADLAASGRVLAAAPALLPPGYHGPDKKERMLIVILEIGLWGFVFGF